MGFVNVALWSKARRLFNGARVMQVSVRFKEGVCSLSHAGIVYDIDSEGIAKLPKEVAESDQVAGMIDEVIADKKPTEKGK